MHCQTMLYHIQMPFPRSSSLVLFCFHMLFSFCLHWFFCTISFQGLFKEQGKERYGAQYRMWQTDAANFEIDGHYPVRELWARARLCWDEMLASPSKSILVVAHNAVNQALVATSIGERHVRL